MGLSLFQIRKHWWWWIVIVNFIVSGVNEESYHCDRVMKQFAGQNNEETNSSTRVGANLVEINI